MIVPVTSAISSSFSESFLFGPSRIRACFLPQCFVFVWLKRILLLRISPEPFGVRIAVVFEQMLVGWCP